MCTLFYIEAGIPYSRISQKNILQFALKQAFCDINFAIGMLIVHVCALVLLTLQINFWELDQMGKNAKF